MQDDPSARDRGLTRRQLLVGSGAAALALSLHHLAPRSAPATGVAHAAQPLPDYTAWEDVYRTAWRWDRVVKGTHLRANCFSACAFDLYVKDGVVWREEQADVYGRDAAGLPDYAPRGCQKGNCYSSLALSPGRLTYPLERVGPRGSGQWRRLSWDEAYSRIADAIVEAAQEAGIETVVYDNGTSNVDWGPSTIGEMRLFTLMGATMLDGFAGTGDLAKGALQTWGTSFVDGSSDDWCRSDTLIFWHCNPVSTRIPDAHFATEARYRGTTVVTVSPDLSPSAIHASLWVNARLGSDTALALGLVRALLARNAIDEAYIREQTDLPFLVRDDNGRFLRQSDMADGGKPDVFYVFDTSAGKIVEAPGTSGCWSDSLALGEVVPALTGRFEAQTPGATLSVRPVLDRLRERVASYTPAYVTQVTGVGPQVQEQLAALLATSKRTLIYATWGSCKFYHADLLQRTLILLSALRGQHGHTGSGVRFAAWIPFEGGDQLLGSGPSWLQRQVLKVYTPPPRAMEQAIAEFSRTQLTWTPSHLFLHVHGGLGEAQDKIVADPTLPRAGHVYFKEAVERGWLPVRPAADRPPRVLVTSGVNPLRRWPLPQVIERVLWPKLKLIVAVDTRLSTTGAKADLLLPAAGYYEKRGIKYAVALAPYIVVGDQAMNPLGESKPEWEIMSHLAQRVQERARARGLTDGLATIADRFTDNGQYGAQDDEKVLDRILQDSAPTRGMTWREARQVGAVQARAISTWGTTNGIGSQVEAQGSLSPSRIHVEDKHAWPTLTGRQQFYLDHPWFAEADEVLPRWKPLPGAGGAYPIFLTGGHTRWSIHAIWRAERTMLHLQRGEPSMWMSIADAQARGIRDHEFVAVRNEQGSFRVRARLSAAIAPGEAIIYHAWEPLQFPGWQSNMEVVASPYKPVHFVGDYGHLRFRAFASGPVHVPRGVPVEIERANV
ncbi:MAG: molybdopterin-dependent oxidoreductase [Deltaproteobacteria bacterium]|nr:molybdopterin-dependent oxidoreductase [Deltaproteobacteria bacterium]